MGGFRTFCADSKKFSPKQHCQRVDHMTKDGKCELHELHRKRPCEQALNAADKCPHFQPNRSRCARDQHSISGSHSPAASARSRSRLLSLTLALSRAFGDRSAAAPVPPEPPRLDGTDHLPKSSIEYGIGTFKGAQTTLDGGVIRPARAEPTEVEPPAAAASGSISGASAAGPSTAAAPPPPRSASPPRSAAQREAAQRMTAALMAAGSIKAAGKRPLAAAPAAAIRTPTTLVVRSAAPRPPCSRDRVSGGASGYFLRRFGRRGGEPSAPLSALLWGEGSCIRPRAAGGEWVPRLAPRGRRIWCCRRVAHAVPVGRPRWAVSLRGRVVSLSLRVRTRCAQCARLTRQSVISRAQRASEKIRVASRMSRASAL